MKVSAIQNFTNWRVQKSRDKNSDIFQSTQISFGIANAGKLKILFSYGVPCMYSGIEMIDPSRVQRLMKAGNFKLPVGQLVPLLAQFEHQLNDKENRVFKIIKEESLRFPEYSLKEIFEVLAPVHRKRLRKKQAPIFQQIIEAGHELPDEYRYRFNRLMAETDAKLEGKPIISPFSTVEFKYKLEKIKEDVTKRKENKAIKVLNKMLKEAERLPLKTSSKTEEHQKTVINFLEIIKDYIIKHQSLPLAFFFFSFFPLSFSLLSPWFSPFSFSFFPSLSLSFLPS